MKFRNTNKEVEKIEPQMAPMIDIVFQLLIFFMLTLKIVEPEGDFSINMPLGKPMQQSIRRIRCCLPSKSVYRQTRMALWHRLFLDRIGLAQERMRLTG